MPFDLIQPFEIVNRKRPRVDLESTEVSLALPQEASLPVVCRDQRLGCAEY